MQEALQNYLDGKCWLAPEAANLLLKTCHQACMAVWDRAIAEAISQDRHPLIIWSEDVCNAFYSDYPRIGAKPTYRSHPGLLLNGAADSMILRCRRSLERELIYESFLLAQESNRFTITDEDLISAISSREQQAPEERYDMYIGWFQRLLRIWNSNWKG